MYNFHIFGMNRLVLRVDLDRKLARELKAIKQHLGLETYTETIRYLIHEKYRQIKPEPERPEHVTGVTSETEVDA